MGYGEFGGTGSVKWEIEHTDGESGDADNHGGKGKDKHPPLERGYFTVIVTTPGKPAWQVTVPLKNSKVRVLWSEAPLSEEGEVAAS